MIIGYELRGPVLDCCFLAALLLLLSPHGSLYHLIHAVNNTLWFLKHNPMAYEQFLPNRHLRVCRSTYARRQNMEAEMVTVFGTLYSLVTLLFRGAWLILHRNVPQECSINGDRGAAEYYVEQLGV